MSLIIDDKIDGLTWIEPQLFKDNRGSFKEIFHCQRYEQADISCQFVQQNHSCSHKDVLRGLHFQRKSPQAQLVTVMNGMVFYACVDLRRHSGTFMEWSGRSLSADGICQIFQPPGVAGGYYVLSEQTDLHYNVTELYNPEDEAGLRWNDPTLGIDWPVSDIIINKRDANYPFLKDMQVVDFPFLGQAHS